MRETEHDHIDLTALLSGLAARAPEHLLDRVAARWARLASPIGEVYVAFTDHGISYLRTGEAVDDDPATFAGAFRERFGRPLLPATRPPAGVTSALRTGRGTGLRFDLRELTDFERAVLRATAHIPAGELRPYAWIAREIGRPAAVRAVGTALGRNPVPLLIPCHRVIRSDGAIGEYVFGAETKRRLLDAERVDLSSLADLARRGVHYLASDTTGVVCFPTCHNARRITPEHRHGFRSVDAARRAGYRPCLTCRPLPASA